MNKIIIEKISLQNFGGVARGEYNFTDGQNIIEGSYGSGKSTAYYAYLWALGFSIQNWEPMINGCYRIHALNTEVVVRLNVNGLIYELKRTNESKYQPSKETGEEEYKGTNFGYFIDNQPLKTGEYKEKIAEIFGMSYQDIELLSTIDLFNTKNSGNWDKVARRKYLFKLFDIDNKFKAIESDSKFDPIREYLQKGQDEIEIKKSLNALNTNIQKELDDCKTIIAERQTELAEYTSIDFNALENQKEKLNAEIERLTNEQQEASKNTILVEKNEQLAKLKNDLFQVQNKNSSVELDYNRKLNTLTRDLENIEQDIKFCEEKITRLSNELEDLDIEKQTIEEETFDKAKAVCPTCKQDLPTEKVNELIANFESDKEKRLSNIANKHENDAIEQRNTQDRANTLAERKQAILGQLNELKENVPVKEYTGEIEKQIADLQTEISNIDQTDTTKVIRDKIAELKTEYENVIRELSKKDNIEKITNRINDIKARERELAIQDQERILKLKAMTEYTNAKIKFVNEDINSKFENIRYNFYEYLTSGTVLGYRETCDCVLIKNTDGETVEAEYDALSTGQRVLANKLTVISLQKILGVSIPMFIDDAVLGDVIREEPTMQQIYLVTNQNVKPNLVLINKCYTLDDCDVRK